MATTCPLCGEANRCAMEIARQTGAEPGACWCAGVRFDAALLARVPADLQMRACICERCARQADAERSPAR